MNYFSLMPRTSVKMLKSLGLDVDLSQADRRILKIKISDKELIKFKCDLLEEDHPKEFPNTFSILEICYPFPIKRWDSKLSYFHSDQSEDLIFGYFQYGLLQPNGIEICGVKMYYL